MDKHTAEQRSFNMSQVKAENTKPELIVFDTLEKSGYKFERHYKMLGKPDVVFLDEKVAVFVDGEFWHGKFYKNEAYKWKDFWKDKILANMKRDRRTRNELKKAGWKVIRLWGKAVQKNPTKEIRKIEKILKLP